MILSKLAHSVLLQLMDYCCHKGQALADQFSVTRQAIWKVINELQALSVPITSNGHQGYLLKKGWVFLNLDKIQQHLSKDVQAYCQNITIHLTTNSTNEDAKKSAMQAKMAVVVSEHQKQGRGRSGKTWLSPFAANLYFSAKCIFSPKSLQHLMALSPYTGILLADILRDFGINAKVKWPNDIWVNEQKLAGILIEIEKEAEASFFVTIGIGINILDLDLHKLGQDNQVIINQDQYTSCEKILDKIIDRNLLTAFIINKLSLLMQQFENNSVENLSDIWANYSALFQQNVRLFSDAQEIIGKEVGIQKDGALLIQLEDKIIPQYMGELSLRPLNYS